MSERPRSYALIWLLVLAFVPTTIVVILLAVLLFPDYQGDTWLGSIILAAWVTMYGGIIVLGCCIAGIVAAIVHFRRTRSRWAWVGLGLNILLPLTIPGIILLPPYFGRDEEVWVAHNLHRAASEGKLKKVNNLIQKKGANIDQMLDGYAPLHRAVAAGDLDLVEYLLENGADSNVSGTASVTPLHVLAASHWCLCEGESCTCLRMLEAFIEHGANINAKCRMYSTDISTRASMYKDGPWTPLLIAMDTNNVTQIKHLVRHGADLTGKATGEPALTAAVRLGQVNTVKFLIASGVDVNFGGKLSNYPLMAAANSANIPMMKLLVGAGANPNVTDDRGRNLLHRAFNAINCDEMSKSIESLIVIGTDIEGQTNYGHTPLHVAAEKNCEKALALLLIHGANLNARTKAGQTPLHIAVTRYSPANVRALLDAGADVNARTPDGLAPIHKAVFWPMSTELGRIQREIVETLHEYGADVDARAGDENGQTVLDLVRAWPVSSGHEARAQKQLMIELLEKYSESRQQDP